MIIQIYKIEIEYTIAKKKKNHEYNNDNMISA